MCYQSFTSYKIHFYYFNQDSGTGITKTLTPFAESKENVLSETIIVIAVLNKYVATLTNGWVLMSIEDIAKYRVVPRQTLLVE